MRAWLSVGALLLLLGSSGCRGCEPQTNAAPTPSAAPKPAAAASRIVLPGVLVGSVRLQPGAQLPSYAPQDMEKKVLDRMERGTFPSSCTPPKTTDRTPVRLTADGKLIGVMVTVSEFKKAPERAPRIYDVVIKDCRLTPALVVAMQGDTLRIRNEVDFPFMPSFGPNPMLETLTPGQSKEAVLAEAGVSPVLCGFTAPCGRTDVVVLYHPLYAVTGEDGNFRIERFPADERLNVNAWHPLFESTEAIVQLGQSETKSLELVIAPLALQPTAAVPDKKPAPVAE